MRAEDYCEFNGDGGDAVFKIITAPAPEIAQISLTPNFESSISENWVHLTGLRVVDAEVRPLPNGIY